MNSSIVPHEDPNRQPSVFNFGNQNVRVFVIDGEEWTVAADVCAALDIDNVSQAVSRLDDDEKTIIILNDNGRPQKILLVNEPGLYALVGSSRKPEAKTFRRWMHHDVIPAIRRTGSYSLQNMTPAEMLLAQAQQMVRVERQIAELHEKQAEQAQQIESVVERLDKADYFTVLQFCQRQGIKSTPAIRQMWGKRASELSRVRAVAIDKVIEGAYSVNAYRIDVLLEVCTPKPKTLPGQLSLPAR